MSSKKSAMGAIFLISIEKKHIHKHFFLSFQIGLSLHFIGIQAINHLFCRLF